MLEQVLPPEENFDYSTYLSPFTWRYGSKDMRKVFSEIKTRSDWRKMWVSIAEVQSEYGLVSKEEVNDLKSKVSEKNIDLTRAHEIEEKIRHDLMAEIKTFAEQAPIGGGKIHLGATSADIEDNIDALKILQASNIIFTQLVNALDSVAKNITKYADLPCMAWTHLQPAEPTTVGYRFANYAQDLTLDITGLEHFRKEFLKGKGLKGAVGSSAGYKHLLGKKITPKEFEKKVMAQIGLDSFPVSTQTYPRKMDHLILSILSSISQSVHKFGLDVRILQSPVFGEISEPVSKSQVGSSTMAFKRNPVSSERMCSLARYVSTLPNITFMNASYNILERTLDDSANRRIIISEGFLAVDECLSLYNKISCNISVNNIMIKHNLEKFGVFSGTEAVLMEMVKRGSDRQKMHEKIRVYSFKAWDDISNGKENPLRNLIINDPEIKESIKINVLDDILNPSNYTGDASNRAKAFVEESITPILSRYSNLIGLKSTSQY